MNDEKKPKVFISYSWTVKDQAVKLATRLMDDGVETKVDFWDLKEGNDKYKFMESMVADNTIDYVLILCDETYTQKADDRTGGVGDETVIISSELYGKSSQTKFLPLILSKDENGEAVRPLYIKSRIYFDFSDKDHYEDEYEKLLRHIYNAPLIPKPPLGKKPEWLKNDAISISEITRFVDIMKSASNETRKNVAIHEFPNAFINKAKEFKVTTNPGNDLEKFCAETELKINEMKPLRDSYLDFFKELILSEKNIPEFFCTFMESLYNDLLLLRINGNYYNNYEQAKLELYRIFIWNIFVSTTAYLFYYKKFREVYEILTHTFFLINAASTFEDKNPKTFLEFRSYCYMFDDFYMNKNRLFSKTAEIVTNQIKEPIITRENFAQTDIVLSQLSFALQTSKLISNSNVSGWFANSYIYSKNYLIDLWMKLPSKKYCQKILPLFGVKTVEELKQLIAEHPVKAGFRYTGAWDGIPNIPLKIGDYDLASLN